MARFTSWWKASVYEWDAMLAAMRKTTAVAFPDELAMMDLDFLSQQGRTMSVSDLAERWQWSRSKAHRFVRSSAVGIGVVPVRDRSGTDKAAPKAQPAVAVGSDQDRTGIDVGLTREYKGSTKNREEKKTRARDARSTEPPKTKPKKTTPRKPRKTPAEQQAKREAVASFCDIYRDVMGERYDVTGKDAGVVELLASKREEDRPRWERVVRRYIERKRDEGVDKWLGSCPPGDPSIRQLGDWFNQFTRDQSAPMARVRGHHGPAERKPSKLF
jgi:hypothetical protein|tara:strand:- start:1328 stop:2143 length:816 start_codon:yes stop_codon:yes gene_type:complete